MTVGIVGLGLIGGSFVRAYKEAGHKVLGYDIDKNILDFTIMDGKVDAELTPENMKECDLILLTTFIRAAQAYFEENAKYIDSHTVVIDCLGVKEKICKVGFELAEKYGFTFVGGHPMAGTQFSGYKNSKVDMFKGAPMVLVPPACDDIEFLNKIKVLLEPAGFGRLAFTTAEEHDKMIGFTSQMPHIVSNAFIKSPTADNHSSFSAGSYRDLTRVARLNPQMWAELFLDNKQNVLDELDFFIDNLQKYRDALANEDEETLVSLLKDGSDRKQKIDG